MPARGAKHHTIKARVPSEMKRAVLKYAAEVGECESVIVREALAEYFDKPKRKREIGKRPIGRR